MHSQNKKKKKLDFVPKNVAKIIFLTIYVYNLHLKLHIKKKKPKKVCTSPTI